MSFLRVRTSERYLVLEFDFKSNSGVYCVGTQSLERLDGADCGQNLNKLQIVLFFPTSFYE